MKVRLPPPSKGSRTGGGEAATDLGSQLLLSPELSGTQHFKGPAQNYSTLLLEEASARLLVGARGALFSLNARDIGDGAHKEVSPWDLDVPCSPSSSGPLMPRNPTGLPKSPGQTVLPFSAWVSLNPMFLLKLTPTQFPQFPGGPIT